MAEENKPQSLRDRIRGKAFANRIKSKLVEFDGEKILVKQPTARAYAAIGKDDHPFKQHAQVLIGCTFTADETGAEVGRLFEAADLDAILEMSPKDPLISALTEAMNELTNPKAMEAEATKSP